jgi:lipopolysaccharide/colanic/teichoic acid biosynthesis glycosyltransferase
MGLGVGSTLLAETAFSGVILKHVIKRAFDIMAASAGLFVFSPLLAAVSVVIKLESHGPVFCRQTRYAYNDQEVSVLQFRTTLQHSNKVGTKRSSGGEYTRIGRILHQMGIDRLPLLINVLGGEMSIVGTSLFATNPRDGLIEQNVPVSRWRTVKPGITGWAQVNECQADTGVDCRCIEYDQYYIDNWSFLFDLKIIVKTLLSKETYKTKHIQ